MITPEQKKELNEQFRRMKVYFWVILGEFLLFIIALAMDWYFKTFWGKTSDSPLLGFTILLAIANIAPFLRARKEAMTIIENIVGGEVFVKKNKKKTIKQ